MYTSPEFQNFRNENKKENMPCMQKIFKTFNV